MDYAYYNSKQLSELKKLAKARGGIKKYYCMPKHELCTLLATPDLPVAYQLEKKTLKTLREEAKAKNVQGFWPLKRGQLLDLLYPSNSSNYTPPAEPPAPESSTTS